MAPDETARIYAVGDVVMLRDGRRVKITKLYPEGTFDYEVVPRARAEVSAEDSKARSERRRHPLTPEEKSQLNLPPPSPESVAAFRARAKTYGNTPEFRANFRAAVERNQAAFRAAIRQRKAKP